jgi:hypothetical protein
MSVWNFIGGLFTGDSIFTDNPQRRHRAEELGNDCRYLAARMSELAPSIKSGLQGLDSELAALYGNPVEMPPTVRPVNMEFNKWSIEVTPVIAPMMTGSIVSTALEITGTSYLVSKGEMDITGLIGLVGLPLVFARAGGAGLGIALAIGAISGAIERDKLRDAIHGAVGSRMKMEKAFLVASRLDTSIQAIAAAARALKAAHVTTPAVMEQLQTAVQTARSSVDAVSDEDVRKALASLDSGRSSWTNEDT